MGKVCIAPLMCGAKYEGSVNLRDKFTLQIHGECRLCPVKLDNNTDPPYCGDIVSETKKPTEIQCTGAVGTGKVCYQPGYPKLDSTRFFVVEKLKSHPLIARFLQKKCPFFCLLKQKDFFFYKFSTLIFRGKW